MRPNNESDRRVPSFDNLGAPPDEASLSMGHSLIKKPYTIVIITIILTRPVELLHSNNNNNDDHDDDDASRYLMLMLTVNNDNDPRSDCSPVQANPSSRARHSRGRLIAVTRRLSVQVEGGQVARKESRMWIERAHRPSLIIWILTS